MINIEERHWQGSIELTFTPKSIACVCIAAERHEHEHGDEHDDEHNH